MKASYQLHDKVPPLILEFLNAEAVRLAEANILEPDRATEEKRKGAILMIRDILNLHHDLIYAIDPDRK